jgi:hypothetical protein
MHVGRGQHMPQSLPDSLMYIPGKLPILQMTACLLAC